MKTASMKISSIVLIIFFCTFSFGANYSGGNGQIETPFQISTTNDWQTLMISSGDWAKHFILTTDLDFGGTTLTPIGNGIIQFNGTFNGNLHVIRNGVINQPNDNYVGVFGYIKANAEVFDLGIENFNVTGKDYVGVLTGQNLGLLMSSYTTGSVNGHQYVGGLAGHNEGTISDCYAAASTTGVNCVGGLVGENSSTSDEIVFCYATGEVTGTGNSIGGLIGNNWGYVASCYTENSVSGPNNVGGLVGCNVLATLISCHAKGIVNGSNWFAGGLVGYNVTSSLTFCYTNGSVQGKYDVGGLVGISFSDSTIISCYSKCSVNGTDEIGGLVGGNWGSLISSYATGPVSGIVYYIGGLVGSGEPAVAVNCFWDKQTTHQTTSQGGTGKTTLEMKSLSTFTNAGWDFSTDDGDAADWIMAAPGQDYPKLASEENCPLNIAGFYGINFADFVKIAENWQRTDCQAGCENTDTNNDGKVDNKDLLFLADNWLEGI